MLWLEEKNLRRVLLPTKFISIKANLCIHSSILVETLRYHIPWFGKGGAPYAALHTVAVTFTPQQWQHLLAATLHTITDTYTTVTSTYSGSSIAHSGSNIYTTAVVAFTSSNIAYNDRHYLSNFLVLLILNCSIIVLVCILWFWFVFYGSS